MVDARLLMPYHPKNYRAIDDSIAEENVITPLWAVAVVLFVVVWFGGMYLQDRYEREQDAKRARQQELLRTVPARKGIIIRP